MSVEDPVAGAAGDLEVPTDQELVAVRNRFRHRDSRQSTQRQPDLPKVRSPLGWSDYGRRPEALRDTPQQIGHP